MDRLFLKNIEEFRELNKGKHFSLYDYIFFVFKSKKISSDIYFALIELFWPHFIVYNNYIFLKENFSELKFNELNKYNERIEFWMNLFSTDPYFEDDETEKAEIFAQILVNIWQIKLQQDFPDIKFTVEYLCDKESGDYGLTFYQK